MGLGPTAQQEEDTKVFHARFCSGVASVTELSDNDRLDSGPRHRHRPISPGVLPNPCLTGLVSQTWLRYIDR